MYAHLLTPFAIMQGLWVRQRAPTLPAPAGRSGHIGSGRGAPVTVTGVGDSIMVGTGVRDQSHSLTATYARLLHERLERDVAWHVHGRNGATSRDILEKIVPDAQRADVYVISCGVNDATHGVPVRKFAHSFERIVGTLRRKSPRAAILYGGLPPLGSFPALPWPLSAILAERVTSMQAAARTILARDRRAHCFDFPPTMPPDELASDGFHPAEHACERWAHGLLELWPREPQRDGSPAPTLHGRRRRLSRRQRAVRGDTTGPR